MRNLLVLGSLLLFASCADQSVGITGGYTRAILTDQVTLVFQPGSPVLQPESETRLQALRPTIPAAATVTLVTSGPASNERSRQIGDVLRRPVVLEIVPPRRRAEDVAMLLLSTERLVAEACLGPGQPTARNIWPGDDSGRPRSMPPGCAEENATEAMTVRPADLLQGRTLPPGAALPLAQAVDRYYQQTDTRSLGLPGSPVDPGPASFTPPANSATGFQATPASTGLDSGTGMGGTEVGAGLLQGPLPQPAPASAAPAAPQSAAPATR